MTDSSTQAPTRMSKAAALLKGTQLAVLAGSLFITLYLLAFRSSPAVSNDYFWFGVLPFFFYLLIASIVLVNGFVLIIGLPIYLLVNVPTGRVAGAFFGALSGTLVFWAFLVLLHLLIGGSASFDEIKLASGDFWAFPVGPWCMYFAPTLYGALVGLFTAELESGRSRIA